MGELCISLIELTHEPFTPLIELTHELLTREIYIKNEIARAYTRTRERQTTGPQGGQNALRAGRPPALTEPAVGGLAGGSP